MYRCICSTSAMPIGLLIGSTSALCPRWRPFSISALCQPHHGLHATMPWPKYISSISSLWQTPASPTRWYDRTVRQYQRWRADGGPYVKQVGDDTDGPELPAQYRRCRGVSVPAPPPDLHGQHAPVSSWASGQHSRASEWTAASQVRFLDVYSYGRYSYLDSYGASEWI